MDFALGCTADREKDRTGEDRTGQDRTRQYRTVQYRTVKDSIGIIQKYNKTNNQWSTTIKLCVASTITG